MNLRPVLAVLGAATLLLAAACDDNDTNYDDSKGDDEYDLEAMSLQEQDMPLGYLQVDAQAFNNEEWAQVLSEEDPEGKQNQLETQGRIRNQITVFSWENPIEHLGKAYQFTVHSTLYTDADKASASLSEGVCDLPIDMNDPAREIIQWEAPDMAEQSVGFYAKEQLPQFGTSVDTVVCFRTGRIVHAVVQSGLEGTESIPLSVNLARKMLVHVDDTFNGTAAAGDEAEPTPTEEG